MSDSTASFLFLARAVTAFVALLHFYFMFLEMFLWTKPLARRAFRMTEEQAAVTKALAANQGLYNGFLAAGLLWSLFYPSHFFARELALFFLGCVIVASIYGAYSVSRKILFIQGLPALVAFLLTFFLTF